MQINYKRALPFPLPNRLRPVIDKLTALEFGLGHEFVEFSHVLELFPNAILITTADARIVYANPAWEQLTGYSLQEIEGKNPRFLQSGKTGKKVYLQMWKSLTRGETFNTEELIDKRKDGSEYNINSTIFPIQEGTRTVFYVQIQQDITNRKKLEDLKREFLSTATHELKTPITTLKLLIQSQIQKMAKKEFTKINLHEFRIIDKELTRLTHIIEDLSDVNRLESGKLHMEMKEVNIAYIIRDAVHQMKMIANGHQLTVKLALPVYVIADEDRIKQVLINLLKNALRYSYPSSEIIIGTTVQNGRCVVYIQNEGVGIPKSQQHYIFDRFYQLEGGSSNGMGLGLYIAKKIIEQHKGKVWVKSHMGKLTTFYFSLVIARKES